MTRTIGHGHHALSERPLHVLIDAINDNAHVRGPDRYLLGLINGLVALDLQDRFTIAHAPWQRAFAGLSLPTNFETLELAPPRQPARRVLWHALRFPREVRRLAPDVVLLPNIILAPRLGRPSVMTVHDLAHFRYPEKFGPVRGRLQRLLIRVALASADRLIAVSRFTQSDLEHFTGIGPERSSVILEGAPDVVATPPTPSGWPPFFLYVGQIERSKNIEGLIEAFVAGAELRAKGIELWIAGWPGNAQRSVKAMIARNPDARIRLLGYVGEARLAELYANCLAFTFPSLVEGFGLVLLEAMAHGAPVLAMRVASIPEVTGDAALLIDPDTPGALTRGLVRLSTDADLRLQLRALGKIRLQAFSWRDAARDTHALCQQAIAAARRDAIELTLAVPTTRSGDGEIQRRKNRAEVCRRSRLDPQSLQSRPPLQPPRHLQEETRGRSGGVASNGGLRSLAPGDAETRSH